MPSATPPPVPPAPPVTKLTTLPNLFDIRHRLKPQVEGKVIHRYRYNLYYERSAFEQALLVVHNCPEEVQWFHAIDRVESKPDSEGIINVSFFIHDIYLPKQEISPAYVESAGNAVAEMMNDIRLKHGFFMLNDQGNCVVNPEFVRTDEAMEALQEDVNKVTVWCHSHVNMPCNPSTTDMTQFQEIIDNNKATGRPSVMIILNKQNTYTLYIYDDVSGERIRNPEIFIYENREDAVEGSHSIIEEMKRKLTRRPVAPAQTYTHSKWGEDLTKKNNGTSPPVHHAKTTTNGTIDFNDLAPTHYLGFVMVKFRDKKIFDDLFSILKEETASVGSDSGRRLLLRENINGIMSMMITSKTPESITRNIHAVALGLCALAFPDRLGKKPFSLSDNYSNMIEFFDFYTFEDAAEALIDAWTLVKGRTKDDLVLVMDLIFTCTIREACMTDDLWYHNLNAARLQFSRYPLQDINVPSCKTIPVAKEPEQTSLALVPPTEYPSEDAITYEENDI